MSASLEQRLKKLEDIEQIRMLRYWYAHHANIIDGPGDLDAFSQLFTETGEWDVGLGHCIGPKAIKTAMQGVTTQWINALHLMINPMITVDGDTGTGTWTGLFPFISKANPRPIWGSLNYHDLYVRTDKGWKFQSVKITPIFQPPEFAEIYAGFISESPATN